MRPGFLYNQNTLNPMEVIAQQTSLSLNSRLSKQLQVKPLAYGEEVEFELLNAYKKEKGREEPSCPELWAHVERQTIYDPGQNQNVLIENIISWQPMTTPTGEIIHKPVVKKPEFIKGVCKVKYDEPDTYIYMMRSNGNVDNPFRKGKRRIFRIRNKKRELTEQLETIDLSWSAEKLIRETLDWNGRRAIVEKLNQSPDQKFHIRAGKTELDKMLLELITMAKQFPKKVIMASEDREAKIRVQIADCESMRLLTYDRTERAWRQMLNGGKDVRELCTVDPDKDRVDAILEHFRTEEGRKHYMSLLGQLQSIFKATA